MTKFEEELKKVANAGIDINRKEKTYYERDILRLSEGWVSPEEHRDRVNELIEAKEKYTKLLYENSSLKSQLQQQALPVVPEFVAKDVKRLSLPTLADWNVAVSYISKETLEWLSTTENINVLLGKSWTLCSLKINGFKVEKPQLFYLKHIDMSKKYNSQAQVIAFGHDDGIIDGHAVVPAETFPNDSKYTFTKAEIDSMQTGSYEQIEVTE